MNKAVYCILIFCHLAIGASAQQTLSSKEMVALTPVLAAELDLADYAKKILSQKMVQIVTQNGFGSSSGEIVLTANVAITDKQVTGTVPAQYIISMEVSLYVLNALEGVVIDETSVTLKGIDKAENRAMVQAINGLNPRSPAIRNFMNQSRSKIVDYYTTRIPSLLAKAKSLADRTEYEEALAVLSYIPESVDEYPAIADQMVKIYLKKANKDAQGLIQEANAQLAVKDYPKALNALIAVDPSSAHFGTAAKMINTIKQTINAEQKAALEVQLKQIEADKETRQRAQDDAVMLEKQRIEASKKAAENYNKSASGTDALNEMVSKWFLGKFK